MNRWKKLDHMPEPKIIHYGKHVNQDGDVSALCFPRPRKINLSIASWTIHPKSVTCPKCAKIIMGFIKAGKKSGW